MKRSNCIRGLKSEVSSFNHIMLLLCLNYSLTVAQQKPFGSYSLNGQLTQPLKGKVYLFTLTNQVVDSAQVVGNQFAFKGKLAEPNLYSIQVDTASRRYPVFLENSAMRMSFSQHGAYQVTGSKLHTQWQAYNITFVDPVREELIRLYSERSEALKQGDSLRLNTLLKQNDSVSIYYGTHIKDYIAQKPYTFLNLFLLKETPFSDEYSANMLTEFKNELGMCPSFKQLEQDLRKKAIQQAKIGTGIVAYEFTLPDSSGRLHSLASRHNKVILLDFWASWCGPCIAQFPALKALNTQYSNQGLEIIGISIDDDRRRWLQVLKKLTPAGLQLIATSKDQVLKDNYAVYSIPQVLLIDQDGKIIASNLEGDALRKKMAELLGNKP